MYCEFLGRGMGKWWNNQQGYLFATAVRNNDTRATNPEKLLLLTISILAINDRS